MDAMEDLIKNKVSSTLPDLEFGKPEEVAIHLVHSIGITSSDQLPLLREEDFFPLLRPIQARLCLKALQTQEGIPDTQADQGRRAVGVNQQHKRSTRTPLGDLNGPADVEWSFRVDWTDIKNGDIRIVPRLEKGKKLQKGMRKCFVRRLVTQVKKVPGVTRRIFIQVMADLKRKYPQSFRHELADGKVGKGSIVKKMMDVFDNDNRKPKHLRVESEAPATKAAYGCIKWRTDLPPNQTVQTQEELRKSLAEYFATTRPSAWDWKLIENQMSLTYQSQRKDINKQAELLQKLQNTAQKRKRTGRTEEEEEEMMVDDPDVATSTLADKWPFLFQAAGMKAHFKHLTGQDIDENVSNFIDKQMDSLLEFCKSKVVPTNKKAKKMNKKLEKVISRADQQTVTDCKFFCLILMMATFFKEEWNGLLLIADEECGAEDINISDLPKTPILVVAGKGIFSFKKIYFAADQSVLGTAENLIDGLKLLFCCYYVLNMMYAAEAQITLEFIQRIVVLINPPKGNKRPPKKAGGRFSTLREHAALTKMSLQYEEFLADKENSDSTAVSSE